MRRVRAGRAELKRAVAESGNSLGAPVALSMEYRAMPTETALAIAVIVCLFGVYAGTLAWADFDSRNHRH